MKKWNENFKYYRTNKDDSVDMIDLSNLPRKKWGSKKVIDWEKIDNLVPFTYHGVKNNIYLKYSHKDKNVGRNFIKVTYNGKTDVLDQDKIKYIKLGHLVKVKRIFEDENYIRRSRGNPLLKEFENLKSIIINSDDLLLPSGSDKKIACRCPICFDTNKMKVNVLVSRGFICYKCSPFKSYPEKFMAALLEINNIDFVEQKRIKHNGQSLIFDFYLPNQNCFIEMQGIQHYVPRGLFVKNNEFAMLKMRDVLKNEYCTKKNIRIIHVDSKKASMNYLLNQVQNSYLYYLLNVFDKIELADKIILNGNYNNLDEILLSYKNGASVRSLEKDFGYERTTITRVLKKHGIYKTMEKNKPKPTRKVICLNNSIVFETMKAAAMFANLEYHNNIMKVCRGKRKHAGKHPETGEPLKWMYYEDYINQQEML
ncbi:hypothetical protein [Staphylococcus nepalensis]|uniref:hypothetical protein n=1 Tax=Staphylococcus nepalensis TaxID=214473 RepID=UPI0032E84E62